jgi:hypothetical protein
MKDEFLDVPIVENLTDPREIAKAIWEIFKTEIPELKRFNFKGGREGLSDLLDIMNDYAPRGYYFGTHPKIPDCFGYWNNLKFRGG